MTPEALASFFACDAGRAALDHLEQTGMTPADVREVIETVRREVWRDFSEAAPPKNSSRTARTA